MSVQTKSLIYNDTKDLLTNLRNYTDPLEKDLNRTVNRLVGLLILGLPGAFLADAGIDHTKLNAIRQKIARLEEVASKDPDSQADLALQKSVYQGIEDYTERAKFLKLFTGIAGISSTGAMLYGVLKNSQSSIEIANHLGNAALAGAVIILAHRLVAGNQMDNQYAELAASRSLI